MHAAVYSPAMVPDLYHTRLPTTAVGTQHFGQPTGFVNAKHMTQSWQEAFYDPAAPFSKPFHNVGWTQPESFASHGACVQRLPGNRQEGYYPQCQTYPRAVTHRCCDRTKDFSQPLFVDTSVEYEIPKEAHPPKNSGPLLVVHPQYYEYLRHARLLNSACTCQLCDFYGKRARQNGVCDSRAAPVTSSCQSTGLAGLQPGDVRGGWTQSCQQPSGLQQIQPAVHPACRKHQLPTSVLQPPGESCMLSRYRREPRGHPVNNSSNNFSVVPNLSNGSDSGYSSVEIEKTLANQAAAAQVRNITVETGCPADSFKRKRKLAEDTTLPEAKRPPQLCVW